MAQPGLHRSTSLVGPLLLIADRIPLERETFNELQEVLAEAGFPPHLGREALLGIGPTLIAQGDEADLRPYADILFRYGMAVSLIPAPPPQQTRVSRLQKIDRLSGALMLETDLAGSVRIDKSTAVVAILGDLSGEMVDRAVNLQTGHHAYHDGSMVNDLDREKLLRRVFLGEPVLDLYILRKKERTAQVVRVTGGGFNPEGLGDLKKSDTRGNMQALLRLARENAAAFSLRFEFGLARIPGCRLKPSGLKSDQLQAFSLFGQLMVHHTRMRKVPPKGERKIASAVVSNVEPVQLPVPPEGNGSHRYFNYEQGAVLAVLGGILLVRFGLGPAMANSSLGIARLIGWLSHTGILMLAGGGWCLWLAFRSLQVKRIIENTPTSKVRSMAMGLVELAGKAKRKYAVVAPMSQTPCIWYRVKHYRKDRNGKTRLSSIVDSGHIPFLLDDGTGTVEVDPDGASVAARTSERGDSMQAGGALIAGSSDRYWVEERIPEGAMIYVLGDARPKRKLRDTAMRSRIAERLRRMKTDPEKLAQIDLNGDGTIDAEEWDAAREAAEQAEVESQLRDPQKEDAQVVVARPENRGEFFLIAESEEDLFRNMKMLWTFLYLAGGILATVWGLWNLVTALIH